MKDYVLHSLEICAELDADINDDVYARFFSTSTAAMTLMDHADIHMRGRMLAETLELLTSQSPNYLEWEVNNHLLSYNVDLAMYEAYFQAIADSIANALGAQWNETYANAWSKRTSKLLQDIQGISAAS